MADDKSTYITINPPSYDGAPVRGSRTAPASSGRGWKLAFLLTILVAILTVGSLLAWFLHFGPKQKVEAVATESGGSAAATTATSSQTISNTTSSPAVSTATTAQATQEEEATGSVHQVSSSSTEAPGEEFSRGQFPEEDEAQQEEAQAKERNLPFKIFRQRQRIDTVYLGRILAPLEEPEKVDLRYEALKTRDYFWIDLLKKCIESPLLATRPKDRKNMKKVVKILESLSDDITAGVFYAYSKEDATAIKKESVEAFMFVFSMYRFPIQLQTDVFTCPFFKAGGSNSVGVRIHDGLERSLQGFAAKVSLQIDPSKRLIIMPKDGWTSALESGEHMTKTRRYSRGQTDYDEVTLYLYNNDKARVQVVFKPAGEVNSITRIHNIELTWGAANQFAFLDYYSYSRGAYPSQDGPWTAEDVAVVSPFELAKLYDPSAKFGFVHFYAKAPTTTITEAGKVAAEIQSCVKPRDAGDQTFTQ